MADAWSPKLTAGLWAWTKGAARAGLSLADVRAAATSQGFEPDAATLSHLYARAVGGAFAEREEQRYRASVDQSVYLARRPGGSNIATSAIGAQTAPWHQVVKVTGTNTATGAPASQFVTVAWDRLLSRGEAIEFATAAVVGGRARYEMTAQDAEYVVTWRRA